MRSPLLPILGVLCWGAVLATGARAGETRQQAAPLVMAQMDDDQQNDPQPQQQGAVAAMTVRVDRLENTIRQLTGQIEELQFQNKKLTDDLRKMQDDVDFRFQDLNRSGGSGVPAKPARRSDADPGAGAAPQQDAVVLPSDTGAPKLRRSGDAFDPAANPGAPGAPRPLGTTPPSAPLNGAASTEVATKRADATLNAPLDLMRRTPTPDGNPAPDGTGPEVVTVPRPATASAANPTVVASLAPGGTRDEYNSDVDLYKQGQYDSAATGLKSFVDKYPRDRLVPDAVYLLGETYSKLGRHREAAEQYLRLSTDFSKAPRAPDALLRLGMSLNAMGVKEQACATYEEVTRRYPTASPDLRNSVDREMKRSRC